MKKKAKVKRKFGNVLLSKELHQFWKSAYGYTDSFQEFKKMWRLIAAEYRHEIIHNTDGVRLKQYMGDLNLKKVNINNPRRWRSYSKNMKLKMGNLSPKVIYTIGNARRYNVNLKFIAFETQSALRTQVANELKNEETLHSLKRASDGSSRKKYIKRTYAK